MTPVAPVRVAYRDDGVFFVDFGRDAFAQLKVQLRADAGQPITVRLGEKLTAPEHLDPKPGGSIRFLQTTVVDGFAKLTNNDARRMPPRIGAVMPFRYAELAGLPAGTSTEAVAKGVAQLAASYRFDDGAAEFSCSSEQLNAVWALCKYSIKATSFAGVFVDGDRERKPYEADAFINGLGWYCCTDDRTLPPSTDRYLIDHPTWPTEWQMFAVLCAWNDYLYTGDLAALRKAYPDLRAKGLRALERGDGLIATDNVPAAVLRSLHLGREKLKDIVDWPAGERDGCQMRSINTVVNAFHCRALALLARMAEALGNPGEARDLRSAADRSLASFNLELFDRATGLYVDGEGSAHSSQHANLFPLAFGLVPTDRRTRVVDFVRGRGMACSVYGAQFLLDGLFDAGAGNDAVALMLAPGDRSWRHMVEDVGTTLTLEAWDQAYKPNQDWNHAWGAAPANLIPRKVLGIEPGDPGFTRAVVWPRCAGRSSAIQWARGRVPTANGPISVGWDRAPQRFHLSLELPGHTTARICLPLDWGRQVKLDGTAIDGAVQDGAVVIEAGPGKHDIAVGG